MASDAAAATRADEDRRATSQEDQLRIILSRVWDEFSADVGLAEMTLHELAVDDALTYAARKPGPWRRRIAHFDQYAFAQSHAAALGLVIERVAEVGISRRPSASRADLGRALWAVDELRRARLRWKADYGRNHAAEHLLQRIDRLESGWKESPGR